MTQRSSRPTVVVGTLVVLALIGRCAPASARNSLDADLILTNGKIITVDERFTIAQAVAIAGDRIVAVGTNQDITRLAGPNTRRIDLRDGRCIPGLIDNHLHLLRAGNTWMQELRFDGVESRKKAIEMLRARAKAAGPGGWVFNIGGWAHQQFADDPKPFTREELDQIAPDNPVALQESYYQVFLNSKALTAFGIEAGKPDPTDFIKGSIQRDAAGRADGRHQGRHRRHASGGGQDAEAPAGSARGEHHGARQRHEPCRPDVGRRARAATPTCSRSSRNGRRRASRRSGSSASAARPPGRLKRWTARFRKSPR